MKFKKLVAGMVVVAAGMMAFTLNGFTQEYKVTGLFVDVRVEPSTQESVMGVIIKDQVFEVLETEDGWHKIQYGSKEGWVVESAMEEIETFKNPKLEISADSLNVRAKKSTDSDILGLVNSGEIYNILEISGEWIKINYKDGGWVYAQYVEPEEIIRDNVRIKADNVNLRSGPSTNERVVNTLEKGTKLTYVGHRNGWVNVEIDEESGDTAWVFRTLVDVDGVVIPEPRTTIRGTTTTSRGATTNRNMDLRNRIVNYARGFLGVRYVWGGTSPNGFDCSGLTNYVYRQFGININRVASGQARQGTWVAKSDLGVGDLVFFDTAGGASYINHVGIYLGGGNFIHASGSQYRSGQVQINNLNSGFYANTYMTGRTFIN